MSVTRPALYKLLMLKSMIAAYCRTNRSAVSELIQKKIANAESVTEIWCELFSNELYDLYEQLKKELKIVGIFPTAEEMLTRRKSDHTNPILWLANSERGIQQIDDEYVKLDYLDDLNTCVDSHNENFFNKILKTKIGIKLFSNHFYFPINPPKYHLNLTQISKLDHITAWHHLLSQPLDNFTFNLIDLFQPSGEILSFRDPTTGLNLWENLLLNANHLTFYFLKKIFEKNLLPKSEELDWRRIIKDQKERVNEISILIQKDIFPQSEILIPNYIGSIKNSWDYLIEKNCFNLIDALFDKQVYPEVDQLIKIQHELASYIILKENEPILQYYTGTCYEISQYETYISFLKKLETKIQDRLTEIKDDESTIQIIQANIKRQSRHDLSQTNLANALSVQDDKIYGYLYILYLMIKPDGTSVYYPPDLLLKIAEFLVPERFIQNITDLKNDDNRLSFIKWHVIKEFENCLTENKFKMLEKEETPKIESAGDLPTWIDQVKNLRPGLFNHDKATMKKLVNLYKDSSELNAGFKLPKRF